MRLFCYDILILENFFEVISNDELIEKLVDKNNYTLVLNKFSYSGKM
jgi:hypothetical protein